ncbi:MAG TPA: hypothetical protein PLN21_15135 [Gemmatales bacterium]|nr:hypothetical protein [Gemmatales bacterium]
MPPTPQPQPSHSTLLRSPSTHLNNLVDLPVDPMIADADRFTRREVHLEILSDDVLCLEPVPRRPRWLSRLTYATFLGCLAFMIYCGIQGVLLGVSQKKNDSIIMWACFAGVPLLILIGALIYPLFKAGEPQFHFDRDTRLMTVQRCYGLSKKPRLLATYSLDDVVALQLLFRYYKAVQAGLTMDQFKNDNYEMNLVFRNAQPARVNLAAHCDWRWMRQAGHRLGEFLDLQVVDQLCQV